MVVVVQGCAMLVVHAQKEENTTLAAVLDLRWQIAKNYLGPNKIRCILPRE
jgi:hypothetical protein